MAGPEKYTSTAYMNTPQADNRWCKAPALSLQKEVLQALLNDLKKALQTAGVEIKKDKKWTWIESDLKRSHDHLALVVSLFTPITPNLPNNLMKQKGHLSFHMQEN